MKIALPTQFHTQITSTLNLVKYGLTKKIVVKVVNRNMSIVFQTSNRQLKNLVSVVKIVIISVISM